MSVECTVGPLGSVDARRSELERAALSIQRERVALTEALMRLAGDYMPATIETLIVSLLRLRRVVEAARDRALIRVGEACDDSHSL